MPPAYHPHPSQPSGVGSKPIANFAVQARPALPPSPGQPLGKLAPSRVFQTATQSQIFVPKGSPLVSAKNQGRTIQSKSKAYNLPEGDRPIEIGGTLFLFRGGLGRTKLLVSAHGMEKPKVPKIRVPGGMTIHFYNRHGDVLVDPGLVLPGGDNDIERPTGAKIANYTLSKYQGRPAAESYEDIVAAAKGNNFDVLTVRHRFYNKEVTLQAVLTAIAGRGYTDIYLNACRYKEEMDEEDLEMRWQDNKSLGYERLD